MTAESITSTAQTRPHSSPGEGSPNGQHNNGPAERRTVTTPSTPGPLGPTALHFRGNVAAHQLAVALTWARRGHPVIPCSRQTKRPLVGGFDVARTEDELAQFSDLRQVESWWAERYRSAHVGLLTRRLVVVDCDVPKDPAGLGGRWEGCTDGTDVLSRRLAEAGADWPETYTVLTPSGGVHLFFEQPAEPIGCRTGTGRQDPAADPAPGHIGPLVDVRGVGGYVIAPGSFSARQGHPYERISPAGVMPAPLPAALIELLRRPVPPPAPPVPVLSVPVQYGTRAERYARSALNGAAEDIRSAPEGRGNAMLFARARHLAEIADSAPHVITLSELERHLAPAALARGGEWTSYEALATIRSGWNRGRQGAAA